MKQVTYKAGEIIFRYGDAGESGYSIIAGVVEVFIERDREAVILGRVSSGEFLGEMAILDRAPRSASARAVTDVTAQEFNHEELIALIASKPETARRVIERLNGRLRSMNESYTSLILGEADAAGGAAAAAGGEAEEAEDRRRDDGRSVVRLAAEAQCEQQITQDSQREQQRQALQEAAGALPPSA